MKKFTFTLSFILGHSLFMSLYYAAKIYLFDMYDLEYGKNFSFQSILMLVGVEAYTIGMGFGIGVGISKWCSAYWKGLLLGAIFVAFTHGAGEFIELFNSYDDTKTTIGIFSLWFGGSFLVPFFMKAIDNKINKIG